MSEAAAAIAESHSALLKEARFSLVELDDDDEETPTHSARQRESEASARRRGDCDDDDDFVVYSDASSLHKANDISHKFESYSTATLSPDPLSATKSEDLVLDLQKSEKKESLPERHEIKLDAISEDETSGTLRLANIAQSYDSTPAMISQEETLTSFQDVPLLQNGCEGAFFNGLVFCDTVDSLYRPVVVINTRAIPHKSLRTAALRHLREALEPVVSTGPYVLIFTSFSSSTLSKLPISWILAAYRELSYPFRKNVQHVILVRPNKLLKAFVKVMKMVVKKKAHAKVKQILYLGDIETVTNGEVTLEHLSPKVIRALGAEELAYSDFSLNT